MATTFLHNKKNKKMEPLHQLSEFERHMQLHAAIFAHKCKYLTDKLHDKLADITNIMHFVSEAMQSVRDEQELDELEKKEMVNDLVHKIVDSMTIPDDQRLRLHKQFFPLLDAIIDMLTRAALGYMYIKLEVEEAKAQCIGFCSKKRSPPGKKKQLIRDMSEDALNGLIDQTFASVKELIKQKTFNIGTIMSISTITMQVVETIPQITGGQKKRVVMTVLHRLVDESTLADDTKQKIHNAIDLAVSSAIDFIVAAANGDIPLVNEAKEAIQTCITNCKKK